MVYDDNLQAFKDMALSQGHDSNEIDAFMKMAVVGQESKRAKEQQATQESLDLYRQRKLIDQEFKTDATLTPGSLTEVQNKAISEGVAELKYDEASGSYKVVPKTKDSKPKVGATGQEKQRMASLAQGQLSEIKKLYGMGDAENVGTGKDLSEGRSFGAKIARGGEGLAEFFGGKATRKEQENAFKSQASLLLNQITQATGSGVAQEAEAERLLDQMPSRNSTDFEATQWFNSVERLLAESAGEEFTSDAGSAEDFYKDAGGEIQVPDDVISNKEASITSPQDAISQEEKPSWLFGDRESFGGKALSAAGNLLSTGSYGAGGIVRSGRELGEGTYQAPKTGLEITFPKGNKMDIGELILPQLVGAYRGLTKKQPLMEEAPMYAGVDPDSLGGMLLGFTAEVLNPDPGAELVGASKVVGKTGKLIKGLFGKKMNKVDDLAKVLTEDPRKFDTAVNKIAQNVVEPAEKTIIDSGKSVKQTKRAINNWIIDSGFEVPAKRADKIRPKEVSAEMIAHGFGKITDMDELKQITNTITGDNGLTTKLTRDAVGSMADEINLLGDIGDIKKNVVFDDVGKQLNISHDIPEKLRKDIGIEISNMMSEAGGSIPDTYDINKLYDVMRALEKKSISSNAKSTYLSKNLQAEDIGRVYKVASDKIRDVIEIGAKERGVVQRVITNDVIAKAYEISPRYAQKLIEAKAKDSLSALRSTAAPFAKLSEVIKLTEAGAISAFKNLGRKMVGAETALGGVPVIGKPIGAMADAITNNKLGRGVAGAIEDVPDFLRKYVSPVKEPVEKSLQRAGILMSRD